MPTTKSITLPFDVTDCRRHFRRYLAKQLRARQQHARRALKARTPTPPRSVAPSLAGSKPLSATDAMQWLRLSPTPFYYWRQILHIHPIVKKNHQALYARTDLVRLHAAYLAHACAAEVPAHG